MTIHQQQPHEPQASPPANAVLKSVCRSCHGGCGVLLHVRDGVLVKVEGDRDSPLNHGRLCPIGTVTTDLVYHRPLSLSAAATRPRGLATGSACHGTGANDRHGFSPSATN
jgi:hypothetical protein